jgi:signal transduction histidine kinase/ActR/RegA family two-component response regulator
MSALAGVAPSLVARARADQVATLYGSWHRTTASMLLGSLILCSVMWGVVPAVAMAAWVAAIIVNQAWRGVLAARYRRARPAVADAPRWGRRWAIGSGAAGALWGIAAVGMFPASPPHQALLIVCLFGVLLGGLNLTAVYKPAFYGFALLALVPLVVRVALEPGQVHLSTAVVMTIVLGFVLGFGHHLNDVLTQSLAMRYENLELIASLKTETGAAESARAAAESANRAKGQFLAAASHDLRQPLHALGLFAAALATRTREPELRPLVASINASVDALEGLFAQLLDLSRLDAGATQPDRKAVALAPLFARLAADFSAQADARGIALRILPSRLAVDSDPLLLERILRNLVANAIRYTTAGRVVVGIRRRDGGVRIDVVDTGPGIAAADCERIFDEFVQLAGMPRAHAGGRGMGLGLAIVRRLSTLLGHPVEVASVPGRGSRFSVACPLAAVATPARRRATSHSLSSTLPSAERPFADRRVVVVDDDAAIVAAMQALFEAWGARVAGGEDVARALTSLAAFAPCGPPHADLIVADLRLAGGTSGIDAVGELRYRIGATTPALIVSGDIGDTARAEAAAAGITLLPKPLVAADLLAASATALGGAGGCCGRAALRA